MTPEHLNDLLQLCEATNADERGFREFPPKTLITFYVAKGGVGLTVPSVEAVMVKGHTMQARTSRGELYVVALDDIFAANIEGRVQSKAKRSAGFANS